MFSDEQINELKRSIAGEIVMSSNISNILKKWRNIFGIGQKKLAIHMGIKTPTLSLYENGYRKNPGSLFIQKIVNALIEIDLKANAKTIKTLIKKTHLLPFITKEFNKILRPKYLFENMDLIKINNKTLNSQIYGYTYLQTYDLKKMDLAKYYLLMGKTNLRLFIFNKTTDLTLIYFIIKDLKGLTFNYKI